MKSVVKHLLQKHFISERAASKSSLAGPASQRRQFQTNKCNLMYQLDFLDIFVPYLFDQTCVFLLTQCPLSGLVKASGSNGNHQGRYASLLCTFPSINAIAVLIQKVKVGNNSQYLKTSELAQNYSSAHLIANQTLYSAGTLVIGQIEKR